MEDGSPRSGKSLCLVKLVSCVDERSIDLDYIDPRPEERREADQTLKDEEQKEREQRDKEWEDKVEAANVKGLEKPVREEVIRGGVRPDWEQSPLEVSDHPRLKDSRRLMAHRPFGVGRTMAGRSELERLRKQDLQLRVRAERSRVLSMRRVLVICAHGSYGGVSSGWVMVRLGCSCVYT